MTGEIGSALQVRQQAAAIWKSLQRPVREGDSLRWLSRLAWFAGQKENAEQYAQAAVEILEKLPPGLELAMAYSNQSQLYVLREDKAKALEWGERAIDLARQLKATEILVHALMNVGTAEIQSGEETGWDHLAQALEMARQEELHDHVARAYASLSSLAVQHRRYEQAMSLLEEALVYMAERDLDSYRVYLLGWLARLHFETGRWSDAEREATDAIRLHHGDIGHSDPSLDRAGTFESAPRGHRCRRSAGASSQPGHADR